MSSRTFLLVLGSLVLGCGGAPSVEAPPAAAEVEAVPADAVPSDAAPSETLDEAAVSTLSKADAKDGAEDKVVSKCALCSLHMDGSDEHVVTAGEYSLHMCSAECKSHYEEDPSAALAKLAELVK